MTDTPETDNEADDAHNMCLDYDCQSKNDNIPTPIVVPADFARKLERERDQWRNEHDRVVREFQHRLTVIGISVIDATSYPENVDVEARDES